VLKLLLIGILALVGLAGMAYSASLSATDNSIAGGADTVAHCKVTRSDSTISNGGVISSLSPMVTCDQTGTYTISYTLTSGAATRTGSKSISLTANVPASTSLPVSPTLSVVGKTYTVSWTLGS
jgi:hypothetical protein